MSGVPKSEGHHANKGLGQKRKKNYYKSFGNKRTKFTPFKEGVKGFLVTCNKCENHALREAYFLLNKYTDEWEKLNKSTTENLTTSDSSNQDKVKREDDLADKGGDVELEKELQKEVAELKEVRRRYNQLSTKTHNVIFIEAKEPSLNPNIIVDLLFNDIKNSGIGVKFCLKIIPVLTTCGSHVDSMKKTFMNLLESQPEEADYYIIPKVRANDSITRDEIIKAVGDAVAEKREKWTPNFDNAKLTIVVNIVNKFCCFSILHDFNTFKKYNPVEYTLARDNLTQASDDIKKEPEVETKDDEGSLLKGEEQVKVEQTSD